ncbi:hypothetical protein F0L68_21625 [Solihabitans fulvus]|uniref:Uncharacterized protein n=1 Tax=Solihabitans fulvus TaxID=1892852 RepID=A0A5B2X7N7_9PSEU|nr:hypothetical protein [Solihabitans fulvus]KAA2259528.1 hypothetical protein F0L68_21625 [Solihabitans fulvus]
MRLRFGVRDEEAFHTTSAELVERFADWLDEREDYRTDPEVSSLLFFWKWSSGDGHLGRWRLPDIRECLVDFLASKLTAPPDRAREVPEALACTMIFLGEAAMLTKDSDPADRLSAYALELTEEFLTAMEATRPRIGPVPLPTEASRRAAAGKAPVLRRFAQLRGYFGVAGKPLDEAGGLDPETTEALLAVLRADGVLDLLAGVEHRQHDADVLALEWYLSWATVVGALRRADGRLAEGPTWPLVEADPIEALDRAVDSLILLSPLSFLRERADVDLAAYVEDGADRLLGEILAGELRADGANLDILAELMIDSANHGMPLSRDRIDAVVPDLMRELLALLAECGVLTLDGGHTTLVDGRPRQRGGVARLTQCGYRVAARRAEKFGIRVLVRPDAADTTAADLASLVGRMDLSGWFADLKVWAQDRPEPQACRELLAEMFAQGRPPIQSLTGLDLVGVAFEEAAPAQVRLLLGGPNDFAAVVWLLNRGHLEEAEIGAERLANARIQFLGVLLDGQGADTVARWVVDVRSPQEQLDFLTELWNSTHARTAEVLDAIGTAHPDRDLARTARRLAAKYRSRRA